MDDNTAFLRAILRQDWDTYDSLVAKFERDGTGTPVAIIGFAFSLAVKQRFEPERDIREIIRFVADTRTSLTRGHELPPRESEALVCAALDIDGPGVEQIVNDLDVGRIAEIEGQLLFKLIADRRLSDDELDAFLAEANRLAADWQAPP